MHRVVPRRDYITDADGEHEAKELKVRVEWVGVHEGEEFVQRARELFTRPRGRGPKLLHAAWEITAHPVDRHGARRAFRDQQEMLQMGREIVRQMRARVALIGCHGLQDLHILLLNDGPTGMALKSYLPNRSNPRRVMVAVADRVEGEINEERALSGYDQMTTMSENRAEERRKLGNAHLVEMLLERVSEDREPEIADLLKAFRSYRWKVKTSGSRRSAPRRPAARQPWGGQHPLFPRRRRRKNEIRTITVLYKRGPKRYDADLLHRALVKDWWKRFHQRENEKDVRAVVQAVTRTIHAWSSTPLIPEELEEWLRVEDDLLVASEGLKQMADAHPSDETHEMLAAFSALRELHHDRLTEEQKKAHDES